MQARRAIGAGHPDTPSPVGCSAEKTTHAWLVEQSASWPEIDAHWLGRAYEQALVQAAAGRAGAAPKGRRAGGVFYTPRALVAHLLDQTLDPELSAAGGVPTVLDPACGCGAFLVEAARCLRALDPGLSRQAIALALHGIDIDPLAARLCRLALWLELSEPDEALDRFDARIRIADTLLDPPPRDSFGLVLGNPPFLSQLASTTARSPAASARLRGRFGDSLRPYTDPAALFLQLGVESLTPGGRLGMVLPASVLASRDAAAVRERTTQLARLRSLWLDTDGIFDAGVRTVAVTLERGGEPHPITRFAGSGFAAAPPGDGAASDPSSWGSLASDLAGVPAVRVVARSALGDCCEITAGFRDEFYAIARAVREADQDDAPTVRPVTTVGLIDPAYIGWGARTVKIAGCSWRRPCVADHAGDRVLVAAITRQSRPKILVATQSKVIEAAVDAQGSFLALTPVIMLYPGDPEAIWRIGALLSSPVISAWASARSFGTARSLEAIKPSASLLREAPLPLDHGAGQEAADHFQAACALTDPAARTDRLCRAARASCRSYGITGTAAALLFEWWRARLPSPRRPLPMPSEASVP